MRVNPWKDITQKELTVRLTPTQGGVRVEYLTRGRRTNPQPSGPAYPGEACRNAWTALQAGDYAHLERTLTGVARVELGIELYRLLFPDPDAASDIFRMLSGSTAQRVYPHRLSVRLRILTDDPALQALPWSLTCAPEGPSQLATGPCPWTFELTSLPLGDAVGRLQLPARVLLICPENAESPHFPHHLQTRLAQDDPSYNANVFFRTARTRDEFFAARDWRPQIVVFLGHAREHQGAPLLCFGEDGALDAARLRSWMPEAVQMLVLTGCWTGAGGAAGLGRQLGDHAPAVFVGTTRLWTEHACTLSRHWLTRVLFDGLTPAQAVQTWPDDVDLATHHGWTHAVHTRYDAWQTLGQPTHQHRVFSSPVSHRLDRFRQRAVFGRSVTDFLKSTARVLVAVGLAPGEEDAHPELLSELLQEDLMEEYGDQLVFTTLPVRFPPQRTGLRGPLEDALRTALGAGRGDLMAFLREAAPRGRQGLHACLWLDFGHLGGGSGNDLSIRRLNEWLEMCVMLLQPHAPPTVKLIAFVTADTRKHADVRKVVLGFRRQAHHSSVLVSPLDVLSHVDRDELDRFMLTSGATRCMPGLVDAATEKLFELCRLPGSDRANYRCLVEAIEAAEEMGWSAFVGEPTESGHDPDELL